MTTEVEAPAEETAAPEVTETAPVTEAPEGGEPKPEAKETEATTEAKPAKVFTQEEVDALIAKRLARAERKRERERTVETPPAAPAERPAVPGKPVRADFADDVAFVEALTDWKTDQKLAERDREGREARAREAHRAVVAEYQKREEVARDKYEDYDDVAYAPDLPITDAMAFAIQNSDVGPELAYHLGQHPKEAARIARLHPLVQARELGKLEDKLSSEPPQPATTRAPEPIKPLGGKPTPTQVYDTTDPRSTKTMTTSEWIAAERKRQERDWKARHA